MKKNILVCLGAVCPRCGQGKLEYNGALELECPQCQYRSGGGCT